MPAPLFPRIPPVFNEFVPKWSRGWIYILTTICFQLSGIVYGGTMSHMMGDGCLMREDVMMITLCGAVGLNMPFPFLFRLKFRFTNRRLVINAAMVVGICNLLATTTESVPLLCAISFIAGFFKLCGTFECMSSAQLWITNKRDFTLFFPTLYTIVVGGMSIGPYLSAHLAYSLQDWHAMSYIVAIAMMLIVIVFLTCTHDFRFMKPMPFVGIDYLGMLLWAAVLIEIIFLFNYGEFYNWFDGEPMRIVAAALVVTFYLTLWRMNHIRHPYIVPGAWQYKRLLPLLAMFAVEEIINSTPKVLQNAFVGSVLHLGWMQTDRLQLVEFFGTVCGMSFIVYWVKVLRLPYTKLLTVGAMALLAYEAMMYCIVMPGLDLPSLYLPVILRCFGYAIYFATLTVYLNDLMRFEHFFMSLTIVGMIRGGAAGSVCSGLYSLSMRYAIADNMSRGLPLSAQQIVVNSIKQLYGATCIMATIVLLILLVWNIQPVRRMMRRIPLWSAVGRWMERRRRHGEEA